jgi:hypothetical protein
VSNDPRGEGGRRAPQTDGISPSTLSTVVIGLVLLIVGIGVALILRYDDEDDPDSAVIPSPSGTSELVRATATATQPVAIDTSPTASDATPSPTVEETPTATANAGLTTSPTEAEIEPTATNTADIEPEPTPSEPPQPSATPEPLEGDFGFLPPAQLPSGGASSTLELTYQLALSLEELPASGTVYLISWPAYSLEDVELARDRLGLEGDVIEEGVGVYRVEGESGMLFVSPTETIFRAADSSAGGELPGESAALQIASEWASLSGFVGADADGGEVVGRDEEVARVVVKIRPTSPQPRRDGHAWSGRRGTGGTYRLAGRTRRVRVRLRRSGRSLAGGTGRARIPGSGPVVCFCYRAAYRKRDDHRIFDGLYTGRQRG